MTDSEQTSHAPERPRLHSELIDLGDRKASGVLEVGDLGRLWLDAGRLYLVETENGTPVAEVLFGAGAARLEDIEALLNDEGASVAADLAARRPDIAPVLGRLLHEHNLNGLFELLVPGEIETAFTEGETHPVGSQFADPVEDLVTQVEGRLDVWRKIAGRITSTSVKFKLARALPEGAEERLVTADEWTYLALLDGSHTVADLITESRQSAFRVTTTLYRLLLEGIIVEQ